MGTADICHPEWPVRAVTNPQLSPRCPALPGSLGLPRTPGVCWDVPPVLLVTLPPPVVTEGGHYSPGTEGQSPVAGTGVSRWGYLLAKSTSSVPAARDRGTGTRCWSHGPDPSQSCPLSPSLPLHQLIRACGTPAHLLPIFSARQVPGHRPSPLSVSPCTRPQTPSAAAGQLRAPELLESQCAPQHSRPVCARTRVCEPGPRGSAPCFPQ